MERAHEIHLDELQTLQLRPDKGPDPTVLRLQTGVVFEWDEACTNSRTSTSTNSNMTCMQAIGEGYIIPSEEQAIGA